MTYLLALTLGASIALCLLLARMLGATIRIASDLCAMVRDEQAKADERMATVEVDSFAAGFEACAEQIGEVEMETECGCKACRAEKYAIN